MRIAIPQRPSLQGGLCHTGLQMLHYGKKTLLLLRCEHWRKACRNFLKRFVVKRAGGTVLPQFLQQFAVVFSAIMFHGVLHRTKRIRIQLPKHLRISGAILRRLLRFRLLLIIAYAAFHALYQLPSCHIYARGVQRDTMGSKQKRFAYSIIAGKNREGRVNHAKNAAKYDAAARQAAAKPECRAAAGRRTEHSCIARPYHGAAHSE